MQALILGIDPGTTLAYALLNLNGKLIKLRSSKQFSFSSLLYELTKYGKIIIIGTDKKTTPKITEKLAAKLGSKIITPEKDLLIKQKKKLTKNYEPKNKHQRDALASAIFAYKRIKTLLKKSEDRLRKNNKQLTQEIKSILLTTNKPLSEAIKFNDL